MTKKSSSLVLAQVQPINRSMAIDIFRGLTVVLMLLVNNLALGKATPSQLTHALWGDGIYIADVVFPWFLFATGISVPFAYSSAHKKGTTYMEWVIKASQRTFWLFLLGMLLTSVVARAPIFSLGVLQLIALAYWCGALAYPMSIGARAGLASGLLLGYWAIIRFIPMPDLNTVVFEEGLNTIQYLNNILTPFNLRGLPSLIPTSAMVLIAGLIGELMRKQKKNPAIALIFVGALQTIAGLLWNLDLEFNKSVWTPSYILYTSGLATILIGCLTGLEKVIKPHRWGFVFLVFGSNALLAYTVPILIKIWILQGWTVSSGVNLQQWLLKTLQNQTDVVLGGGLYTLSYIVTVWLGLFWLYQKRLFLRV